MIILILPREFCQHLPTQENDMVCYTFEVFIPFSLLIVDGADYTGGLLNATFSGSSTAVVQVPTLPDDLVEGVENFTAVILVPAETTCNITAGSPDTATVQINDEDSKLIQNCECFSFNLARFV